MPTTHRKYGGSTMARTLACPGWAALAETVPRVPGKGSDAAELGTALHDAMEWLINDLIGGGELEPDDAVGQTFNFIVITEEMAEDSLWPAWNEIQDLIDEYALKTIMLEPFVEMIPELAGGSIDFLGISKNGKTVVVADYKFGYYTVSAERNAQLLFYALCADVDEKTTELFKHAETIALNIIQPAIDDGDGTCRDEWVIPVCVLEAFEDKVARAINLAESGNAPLNAGDHCKFCPAMAICPIKTGEAQAAAKLPAVHADTLGEWLPKLDDLEAWIKATREMAAFALENGTKVPGYKLVAKRAQRQWTDPKEVEKKMKNMHGVTGGEQYDMKLKSPAQMEKLFKQKKLDFDKITDYIESVSSGSTLAKESDKRPAVLPIGAFKQAMGRLD